jgi:hypothetical protein
MSIALKPFDRKLFRKRLAKMTNHELIQYHKAATHITTLGMEQISRERFVIQLQECRNEWRRRHRKKAPRKISV